MRWTYDMDAGAFYGAFSDAAVARTVELVEDQIAVDLDDAGELVGVEILNPGHVSVADLDPVGQWSEEALKSLRMVLMTAIGMAVSEDTPSVAPTDDDERVLTFA